MTSNSVVYWLIVPSWVHTFISHNMMYHCNFIFQNENFWSVHPQLYFSKMQEHKHHIHFQNEFFNIIYLPYQLIKKKIFKHVHTHLSFSKMYYHLCHKAEMAILSYFDIFAQVSNLSCIFPSECYATKRSRKCLYVY